MCVVRFANNKGTKAELKAIIDGAYSQTINRANGFPRYPMSNSPALRAIMVAKETFLMCFGPDAEWAEEIMKLSE